MKPLLRHLLNIAKGILWWLLVGVDNRIRHYLGFSPLIQLRKPAAPPEVHKNKHIKVANDLWSSQDHRSSQKGQRLKHHWLYFSFFNSHNIAICLRELLFIRQNLTQIGVMPSECQLMHRSIPTNPLNTTLFSLLSYFANHHSLADMNGYYTIDRFITVDYARRFWSLWHDTKSIEMFREELFAVYGIKASPPADRVKKLLLIRRQDPPPSYKTASGNKKVTLRKITNEDDLIAQLRARFNNLRIEAVQLESIPLVEQLRYINDADIMIGMHGAGLIYSLLMKPNSGLIEMFPCHFAFPHTFYTFYAIAAARALHYRRFSQLLPWRETASEGFNRVISKDPAYIYARVPYYYKTMLGDYSYIPPQAIIKRVDNLITKIERRRVR